MKKLVIYGTGGNGRGLLEITEAMNDVSPSWEIAGFLNDDPDLTGSMVCDYPVLGGFDWLLQQESTWAALGIGSTVDRHMLAGKLQQQGFDRFASLIHPSAVLARRFEHGDGCIIFGNVSVDVQSRIGRHVQLGRNSSLGHDVVLGDFVNISPAASVTGYAMIEEGCDIGSNATVLPRITIGSWATVAAGSVVSRNLPANATAVGIPAIVVNTSNTG